MGNYKYLQADAIEGVKSERNYIGNAFAWDNNSIWAGYTDAAGVAPVDGTGGATPNSTFAINTSSPIAYAQDFLFTKSSGASRQGEGFSYDFTIDSIHQARILRVAFDYKTSANYGDGDIRVYIYDVTNSQLIEPTQRDLSANTVGGQYISEFQTNSNSTSYRLILHVSSSVDESWTMNASNFSVGPREIARGSVVNDWQSYTPTTQGFGTVSSMSAWWRRSGDTLYVKATFATGTVAASEAQFGLPNSLTIDAAKMGATRTLVGVANNNKASTTYFGLGVNATGGDAFVNIGAQTSTLAIVGADQNGNVVADTTSAFTLFFSVPITGWSSNANISSDFGGRDISVRAVKTSGSHVTSGSELDVTWDTTDSYDTTSSFDPSTGIFTAPETGKYLLTCNLTFAANATGVRYLGVIKNSSVVAYGPVFPGNASFGGGVSVSTEIDLIARDTLKVTGFQNSGGSLAYSTTAGANALTISKKQSPQTLIGSEKVIAKYYACTTQALSTTPAVVKNITKSIDSHDRYSTSTGLFTAPQSGDYEISAAWLSDSQTGTINNGGWLAVYKNGTIVPGSVFALYQRQNTSSLGPAAQGSTVVTGIVTGDTLGIYIAKDASLGSHTTISDNNFSWAQFRLVK